MPIPADEYKIMYSIISIVQKIKYYALTCVQAQ